MTTDTAPHLADDELLRLLDGAVDPLERARWEEHVAACARCAGAAGQLRGAAALLRNILADAAHEADLPPRPAYAALQLRRTRTARPRLPAWHATPVWLRAAAVLLLVAAPVAAVPAVRHWIIDALRGSRNDAAITTVAPVHQEAVEQVSAAYFVPIGSAIVVRFDAAQTTGELRVSSVEGSAAVLRMTNNRDELPVYSETAELRIRNSAQSAATYHLELPAAIATVSIRIGDRTIATLDAAAVRAGAAVRLQQ